MEPDAVGDAEIRRRIIRLVWPATVEALLQMMVGIVGMGMVGSLGATAIGGVGLANRVGQFVWSLFAALGTGTTVVVAHHTGAGDAAGSRRAARTAMGAAAVVVIPLAALVGAFALPLVRALGAGTDLAHTGAAYLRIVAWGMPAVGVMLVAGSVLRGLGDMRTPMQIAVLVNLLNIVANYGLIFGRLGFPKLGLVGSAVGTAAAQGVGAILALYAMAGPAVGWATGRRGEEAGRRDVAVSRSELRRILTVGLPTTGESLLWQGAAVLLTMLVVGFGTAPLAAHQLGLVAEGLSYMPAVGFGIAATTLVGHSLGARDVRLGERYVAELMRWVVILTCGTSVALFILAWPIMRLLTPDLMVVALGARYLMIAAFAQLPQQAAGVLAGALRGAADTRAPMFINAAGMWLIRLPTAYLLSKVMGLGITGVWIAMDVDLISRFLLMRGRYRRVNPGPSWRRGCA